jgi:F-actin capping protein, beta subunit
MDPSQSIAHKTPPVALEVSLDGLRTLLTRQNNVDALEALMKKYYIPFDDVIDESDKVSGEKPFLAFQYNKVGENKYRSPWTNNIYPKKQQPIPPQSVDESSESVPATITTAKVTNENIRNLEKSFNDVWDSYKNLYYGHDSIGSVYLKEPSSGVTSSATNNNSNTGSSATTSSATNEKSISFHGCFGIRKRLGGIGSWDSVSVVTVDEPTNKDCTYHVDTYVRVVITPEADDSRGFSNGTKTDISLIMSKDNVCTTCPIFPDKIPINMSHIENIGTIIEDNEMEVS